jgi:hypothetical protein
MVCIEVFEQSSAYDEYDTENGRGHHESIEPERVVVVMLDGNPTDDDIQTALDQLGVGQWDGGNVAYDHDGSHMAPDGTITTRYAVVNTER